MSTSVGVVSPAAGSTRAVRALGVARVLFGVLVFLAASAPLPVTAEPLTSLEGGPRSAVQLTVLLTLITLAPALILSCTTFARFIIVFSFLKMGLGTPGAPPSQILTGLALFMTLFVMAPVLEQVRQDAVTPYLSGEVSESEALERAAPPIRRFLLSHCQEEDLALFYEASEAPRPESWEEVPLRLAIPAFALSELRLAFQMGFVVLLPFLVIDLVVATVLSSLGMVMLPPTVVALPIKLMVFLAADGWRLIVGSLVRGIAA